MNEDYKLTRERVSRRIKSLYMQISEIDMEHSDFGTPGRLEVIHGELNELLSEIQGTPEIPPIRQLDIESYTSRSYQQLKADILKLVAIFNVEISTNVSSAQNQQINVHVIQSNVQNSENRNEVINNLNISNIKKEEIKKLFAQLEQTAKNNSLDEKTQNSQLRMILGKIVNLSLDAGIMGLRWANENGLIDKIFGH